MARELLTVDEIMAILPETPRRISAETVDRSARSYGDWMAAHEREHCEQIAAIVGALKW